MKHDLKLIHEVQLPSTPASITEVESLIDVACTDLSLSEELYGNVLIAVTEGVNNAIIHGNKLDAKLSVHVGVLNNESWVCFSIKDQGKGFDPNSVPDPTEPQNLLKPNGRGIFLMRNLSDEVTFEDNGSLVNVCFRR